MDAETPETSSDELVDALYALFSHVNISEPSQTTLSPEQKALYDYGNTAGAYIKAFEDAHMDMAIVLQDELDDQGNPQKRAALLALAKALADVGHSLKSMANVPPPVASFHIKIADSYEGMGEKLALIPETRAEDERLEAVITYNAVSDTFTEPYIALVELFSVHGVTFTADEPGSVFTFTATSF